MSFEHPIEQEISSIIVDAIPGREQEYIVGDARFHTICTRIEACTKSGMHADIPYVRVWAGDICLAEFCQHNIVGVYFKRPQ